MTERSDRRGLAAGYRLEQYEIRDLQRADRVGLRYTAFDHASGEPVGLREYLPAGVAARREGADVVAELGTEFDLGLAGFVAGAVRLAGIDHPNVARARGHVRANGTAYLVTDTLPDTTLARRLDPDRALSPVALAPILHGLLDGLEAVHRAGLLHGQLSPETIALDRDHALLIDFGVAPQAGGTARRAFRPASKFHTDPPNGDFAALEQYADRGQEGPWTDLYALAAVMYRCVTGQLPPNALHRALQEEALSLRDTVARGYDPAALAGIEAALAIRVGDRPRNVAAWRELLAPAGDEPPVTRPPGTVPSTARTAARGFRQPAPATPATPATPRAPVVAGRRAARAREEASTEGGGARWGFPAVVLVALISVLTWVDAGVLRAPAPAPEASQRDESSRAEPAERPPARVEETTLRPAPDARGQGDTEADVAAGRPSPTPRAQAPEPVRAPAPGSSPTETVVPPRAEPETTAESGGQTTDTAPRVETAPPTSAVSTAPEDAPPSQTVSPATPSAAQEAPSPADPGTDDPTGPRADVAPPDVRAPERVPVPAPVHTLTLELVPADARVSFADEVPPYRPGMELPPGSYRILVTRTGFLPELRTVRVSGATRTRIVLEPDSRGAR